MKRAVVLLFLLVVMSFASACSGGADTSTLKSAPAVGDRSEGTMSASPGSPGRSAQEPNDGPRAEVRRRERSDGSNVAAPSGRKGPSQGRRRVAVAPIRPAPGSHHLTQVGWEEFCQGPECERNDLPASIDLRIDHGSDGRFTTRLSSGSTDQTVSYRLGADRLVVEKVVTSSSYRGLSYTTTVAPDRPIVALRLPLEAGSSWSGTWTNRERGPDGSYSGRVLRRTMVRERGREIAYVVRLKLFFTGEVTGYTDLKTTIATRDLMILSTHGRMEAQTSFGTYRSRYESSYTD